MYIPKDAKIAIIYSQEVTSKVIDTSVHRYDSSDRRQFQNKAENLTYSGFQKEIDYLLRNGYYIIDREYTDQIIKEQKFGISGFVNPTTAAKIGNLTGASHLLIVKYIRHRELKCGGVVISGYLVFSYYAEYKLIECSTGRLVSSYNVSN